MSSTPKWLSFLAIPHLPLLIIVCQFVLYLSAQGPGGAERVYGQLSLIPERVMHHQEWWRLFSFVFLPPLSNPVFLIFGLYFFWLMSKALESQWGVARFNLYYLIGWAALVALGMGGALLVETGVLPEDYVALTEQPIGNQLLASSLFLAFAWLFPRFTILVFFIIPVQVRWLALLTWLAYLLTLCTGTAEERITVLAGIANFLLFFGTDIIRRMRRGNAEMVGRVSELRPAAFHRCANCGVTELTAPDRVFRICTDCQPARELCTVCLKQAHEHIVPAAPAPPRKH